MRCPVEWGPRSLLHGGFSAYGRGPQPVVEAIAPGAMLTLYCHPISIMPLRVHIALREKGLAYEEILVDVYSSPTRTQAFLDVNPFGQIPVLDDDGFTVAESMAILEYLEERHPSPPLLPRAPRDRARARQLMCWSTDYWPPAWKQWIAPHLSGATWTDESVREGRRDLARHLDVLASFLSDDWLVGPYSLADVCYAPLVLVLELAGLGEEVTARPVIGRWLDRLRARVAVREAMEIVSGAQPG